MRAREPDESGYVVNDGVRVYYEVHGSGAPTLLLMPTWAIVTSGHWKMQVPDLARHARVITFDPRGNGRSDRPQVAGAYGARRYAADAQAVLDATGTERAILVAHCSGVTWSMLFAQSYPTRVAGLVAIAPNLPLSPPLPERAEHDFEAELAPGAVQGWAKQNRHYWQRDWPGYVDFFMSQVASDPHSTKLYDDLLEWGLQTDAATMLCEVAAPEPVRGVEQATRLCQSLSCPTLVIVGEQDRVVPAQRARRVAELAGAELLALDDAGHLPHARYPVVVNHAIRDFVQRTSGMPVPQRARWAPAHTRRPRALWVCSPIGLGHVLRDLAIAAELRRRVPELQIEWWAQPPVTDVLLAAGEHVHPASAQLASESAHWESQSSGHELPAFEAFRRMDEIFCANYLLFDDIVRESPYDLWVGDESWEIDYFLHENPDRKIAPYAFLTDLIGFLPTDPDDVRQAQRCADYNADAIDKRERFPYLRDVSMFIGDWAELPDASFGPGLPRIRPWSRRWYESVPYVLPYDPASLADRQALRQRFGYGPEPLLVATVGGTSVGASLLELTTDAFSRLRKELPDARMVLVAGPRIDPNELPDVEGLDKHGYLPDVFARLACADAAVVQGGLSTTMELVAANRPFVYFPLRGHWEQQHFVTHRLDYYHAGLRMDYASTSAQDLAQAMGAVLEQAAHGARFRPVASGGAAAAGQRLAQLLGH